MKARTPRLRSIRLMDQVRKRIRYLHYGLSTEKLCVCRVRFLIRWHGLRHPRDISAPQVEAFLAMLANERRVSASTHNQALSALLLLYREVPGVQLGMLCITPVLTTDEVAALLAALPHTDTNGYAQACR